eukprot:g71505.t1
MRLDRPLVLVYVDDVSFFRLSALVVRAAQEQYAQVMGALGFMLSFSKHREPCVDQILFALLGLGPRSFFRQLCSVWLHPRKLLDIVSSTKDFLVRRIVTGRELSRLLCKWFWSIFARLPAFAVLQQCFSFAFVKRNVQAVLWGRARAELEILVFIAPLL